MKLLPKGELFSEESKPLTTFVQRITKELDRVKQFIDSIFSETPIQLHDELEGTSLKGYLTEWEIFSGVVGDDPHLTKNEVERINAVISKFSAAGGQSLQYLSYVASKAAGREVIVTNSKLPLTIEVQGISIEKISSFSCKSSANQELTKYSREENIINTIENIKHAHLDSRYYDNERKVYAQD